jgi:enoyl-CoA hydratase/carnithine racemase
MNTSGSAVRYEVSGYIARITIDRPPVNALDFDMIRSIVDAFERAAQDDRARTVVLGSAVAKRFCAGLDLKMLAGKSDGEVHSLLQLLYVDLHDAQYNLGKPSIAAVRGTARGGGMSLAISCDVILASQDATFSYPEIDVGVIPAIHFAHLPRIVGRHLAFEPLFTGRAFDAEKAFRLGLVRQIVPDAELDSAALALAAGFAAKSPVVIRLGRAAFRRQNDLDYRRSIASAVEDFCNVITTDSAQRGLQAFVDKGKPPHVAP